MILSLQSSGFFDLSGLTFSQVEAIYRKTEFANIELMYAAIIIGVVLSIFRIVYLLKKIAFRSNSDDEGLTVSDFFQLLLEKWYFGLVILAIPFLFTGLDAFLSVIFKGVQSVIGEPENDLSDKFAKEALFLSKKESSLWSMSIGDIIDYSAALTVQPFLVLIEQWIYGMALLYRFYFLGLVKMTAGFAIVSLLNENTKQYFFTWLKALLICYLLIPAFLFANAMMENVKSIYLTDDNFSWYISLLTLVIAGKLLLFTSSKIILWRIL